jgi:hypothetical protein
MGAPTFYQPLFNTTNMLLPRDRRERNEWCRHFYRTEPLIATALDLHTEFPISQFSHVCSDPYIKKFFDNLAFNKLDMINLLLDIGLEYWKIGDVFPFGQFNETEGTWEQFTLLNPDYVNISSSIFAQEQMIELIPDDQVMNIISGGPTGEFAELYRQFPDIKIIAEDLGDLFDSVLELRDHYNLPGMRIMEFCVFDPDVDTSNTIVYPGTHDNDTLYGWYKNLNEDQIAFLNQKFNNPKNLYNAIFDSIWNMNSLMTIFPLQDLLKLDNKARINSPGTVGDHNWSFKLKDMSWINKVK